MHLDRVALVAMLVIMRADLSNPESISQPPLPGRRWWWALAISFLALGIAWTCLHQGLNWDEPWILDQARRLANRQPTEPFKPLAGLLALPFVSMEEPWIAMRLVALGLQGLLGWVIWRLLAREFDPSWRWLALTMLWLEPTFRERALELRTEIPSLIAICIAILVWRREWPRIPDWCTCLPMALGLGLAPKAVLWLGSWFLLAVLRDWKSKPFWKQATLTMGYTIAGIILLWCGVAFWTHRQPFELFLASGQQNQAALTSGSLFPPQSRFYLLQTLSAGWPFYLLVVLGLSLGRMRSWSIRSRDLLGSSVLPWLLVPVYAGAFPYHFAGLIPPLIPAVMKGLQALLRRFGTWGFTLPIASYATVALIASLPVLSGPELQEQVSVLRLAKGYLQPGLGYVDGVGMLSAPQSAFFVTSQTVGSMEASQLVNRWEKERVSLFILNGRAEQLLSSKRLEWVQHRFVQVHPNLLVLGSLATGEGTLAMTWRPPWAATFRFTGTPSWTWTLNGQPIFNGQEVSLPATEAHISGSGQGRGQAVLALSGSKTTFAEPVVPFFLPFQRP